MEGASSKIKMVKRGDGSIKKYVNYLGKGRQVDKKVSVEVMCDNLIEIMSSNYEFI